MNVLSHLGQACRFSLSSWTKPLFTDPTRDSLLSTGKEPRVLMAPPWTETAWTNPMPFHIWCIRVASLRCGFCDARTASSVCRQTHGRENLALIRYQVFINFITFSKYAYIFVAGILQYIWVIERESFYWKSRLITNRLSHWPESSALSSGHPDPDFVCLTKLLGLVPVLTR